MEGGYQVKLGDETKEYVKRILSFGSCPMFFPASTVRETGAPGEGREEKTVFCFHTDGFLPLREVEMEGLYDAAAILCALAVEIDRAQNHYMCPKDYRIDENTVFVRRKGERVRLRMVYEPALTCTDEESPLKHVAGYLLDDLLREYPQYGKEMYEALRVRGGKIMLRRLELFKRKMYAL